MIQCISGIPSIVLGLFAYSFLVRDLNLGRCIFSAGVALAVMILPFIEVRAEKAFREVPAELVRSSYSLGCSKLYTIMRIVLPVCRGELVSGIILGGCYAMGATAPMIFTGAVALSLIHISSAGVRNRPSNTERPVWGNPDTNVREPGREIGGRKKIYKKFAGTSCKF